MQDNKIDKKKYTSNYKKSTNDKINVEDNESY